MLLNPHIYVAWRTVAHIYKLYHEGAKGQKTFPFSFLLYDYGTQD